MTFPTKRKPTRSSHFYSRTKKRILSEKFFDDEIEMPPKKADESEFTFLEYQRKYSSKNRFLNKHRKTKEYCPNLIKN